MCESTSSCERRCSDLYHVVVILFYKDVVVYECISAFLFVSGDVILFSGGEGRSV